MLAEHRLANPSNYGNDFMRHVGYTTCKQWQEGMWREEIPASAEPPPGWEASYALGPNLNDLARREFAGGWDKRLEETQDCRRPVQAARDQEGKRILLALLLGCALFWIVVFKLIF